MSDYWLKVLISLLLSGLVAVGVAMVRNLGALLRSEQEQIELLRWLKNEHLSDDSKFSTVHVIPLLEQTVRIAKGTQKLVQWAAERQTGERPPPPVGE